MSNQGVRQEVNPSQEPEVGAWGGREAAAIRAVGPDSSTVTPGRPQNSDQLSSSDPKTPDPIYKPFPEEEKAKSLMVESGTEKLTESLEEGGGFSPVSEPDGIGAVVLRTDWIVETLNGGTRLSYFHERNVALLRVATGLYTSA